jgi:hypothetical protein
MRISPTIGCENPMEMLVYRTTPGVMWWSLGFATKKLPVVQLGERWGSGTLTPESSRKRTMKSVLVPLQRRNLVKPLIFGRFCGRNWYEHKVPHVITTLDCDALSFTRFHRTWVTWPRFLGWKWHWFRHFKPWFAAARMNFSSRWGDVRASWIVPSGYLT